MSVEPPVTIRAATRDDRRTIRELVRKAHLDPTGVRWPHFLVAEQEGVVVGIGQVRRYRNCRELGSLVVRDDRRGQGIGGQIVEALLARHHGEVFLECRAVMVPYYRHFGFEEIPWQHAPHPLRFKAGLGDTLGRLVGVRVAVMVRR